MTPRCLALIGLLLGGCTSVRYLSQAAYGQLRLMQKAQPLARVLADPNTHPRIRRLLLEIEPIKAFGKSRALRLSKNYTSYVQLEREAVVWVVNASRPLEFETKVWNFPIVGSFPYLGWFDEQAAIRFARGLGDDGWDANARPAQAFSTLGWFRDPVLSSMLEGGDEALGGLVNVVLHESVHATIHISDQAFFNESIAVFIADRMTPSYLAKRYGKDSDELRFYVEAEAERNNKRMRLSESYVALDKLYKRKVSDEQKRKQKETLLTALTIEIETDQDLNNAVLVGFRTYGVGMTEFEKLFTGCDSDWPRFIKAVRTLETKSFSKEHDEDIGPVILKLVKSGC